MASSLLHVLRHPLVILSSIILLLKAAPAWLAGKMAYAFFGLSALASLTTAPCPGVSSVQRLVAQGDTLYAHLVGHETLVSAPGVLASRDNGNTWDVMNDVPAGIMEKLAQEAKLPLVACDPCTPLACYRIDGQPRVEESLDGGTTWRTAWSIPPGRRRFMERAAKGSTILSCGKTVNFATFDMAFTQIKSAHTLVVAMGNEGLLIHTPGGAWQRRKIDRCFGPSRDTYYCPAPTMYAANSFREAIVFTQPEWFQGLSIGFLVYLLVSILAWSYIAFRARPEDRDRLGWVIGPTRLLTGLVAALMIGWFILITQFGIYQSYGQKPMAGDLICTIVPLAILIVSAVVWTRAGRLFGPSAALSRSIWIAPAAGILVFLITGAGFSLWADGVIASYEQAQTLVIMTAAGIILAGILLTWYRLRKLLAAGGQSNPTV